MPWRQYYYKVMKRYPDYKLFGRRHSEIGIILFGIYIMNEKHDNAWTPSKKITLNLQHKILFTFPSLCIFFFCLLEYFNKFSTWLSQLRISIHSINTCERLCWNNKTGLRLNICCSYLTHYFDANLDGKYKKKFFHTMFVKWLYGKCENIAASQIPIIFLDAWKYPMIL